MKLALVQMRSSVGDISENVAGALRWLRQARDNGADLVVLPEFFSTGFFASRHDYSVLDLAEVEDGPTLTVIREEAAALEVNVVVPLFERQMPGIYFNTAFVVADDGTVMGRYRKVHPAAVPDSTIPDWETAGDFEKLYVRPGAEFGVWQIRGINVGVMICYDHYFPEAARCLTLNGAELIVGPYAAVEAGDPRTWDAVMQCRALENGVYIAPCNQVGSAGPLTFQGNSMVVDPSGRIVQRGATDSEGLVICEVNRDDVVFARKVFPIFRDRVPTAYQAIVRPE